MTTWSTMRANIRGAIKDTNPSSYKVGDAQLLAYLNYALDWVATRHPLSKTATVTLISLIGTLPVDTVVVRKVYSSTKELEEIDELFPSADEYTVFAGTNLKVGDSALTEVSVIYDAYYPAVSLDADTIPGARWLEEAIFWYTASRGMAQRASDVSAINQWDSKNDSGNPEHNPLLRVAEHFEKLALRALAHPGGH